jgi:hypothetical protein
MKKLIIFLAVLEVLRSDCMLAWWKREKIAFSPQFGKMVDGVLSLEKAAAHRASEPRSGDS